MQHLWAPWRMTYIAGESGGDEGCIFCSKPAEGRDEENLILHRGKLCFVIMNLFPYNNGHLMIAPYEHVATLNELGADHLGEIMLMTQRCISALGSAMHPQGYNIGINQGTAAGAGIADHVHMHIVPRWTGDTNFMPVLADVKVMPDFLHATWLQLRAQFAPYEANG